MILRISLNTKIIWTILKKTMKNTIQIKYKKDYMNANMLSNKKLNPIVNQLFIRGRKLNIFYYTVLFFCIRKYCTKLYRLFYH